MTDVLETPVATAAPVVDDAKKTWLIVAGGSIPAQPRATVIVVEHWTDPKGAKALDSVGHTTLFLDSDDQDGKLKTQGYPKGADAYLRISDGVDFGDTAGAPIYVIGENLVQTGVWGFERHRTGVCVGPHPVWAAANIAAKAGATLIKIQGLTDAQKSQLQPFIDNLKVHKKKQFRSDVDITFV